MRKAVGWLGVLALTVAACSPSGGAGPTPGVTSAPSSRTPPTAAGTSAPIGSPRVIVDHLDTPWGLTFLPGGDALVGERDSGRILRVNPDGDTSTVATLNVLSGGESGLLGLARSPSYRTDHLVYAYYTSRDDNRVVRFTVNGRHAGPIRPILTGIPKAAIHDGGRIAFGPDGMLYIGTGETGNGTLAQDRGSLGGKILRIRSDGSIPDDNPFPGSPVWSLGHRNVQGMAWDADGRMYAAEFGPDRADEINRIRRGGNYGWPRVVGREPKGHDPRYIEPLVTFPPGQNSASGLAITSDALWTAALRGTRLWRIPEHADGGLGRPRPLLVGQYGRLRTIAVTPTGDLWVTTSNRDGRGDPSRSDDRILRIPLR